AKRRRSLPWPESVSSLKSAARALTPPLLWRAASRLLGRGADPRPEWEYVAADWPANDPRASGWSAPSVTRHELDTWAAFVESIAPPRPLASAYEGPTIFYEQLAHHNVYLSFAYVLGTAARHGDRLRLLDWGCGLGQYLALARSILPD